MAPVVGPLLDRFRHGRRYAIAATMLARCFATWVLAGAVAGDDAVALPGGVRLPGVVQGVRRHALGHGARGCCRRATPWSRPTRGSRWPASSPAPSAPGWPGCSRWPARRGRCGWPSCVFLAGMVLALRLPPKVDSTVGETPTTLSLDDTGPIIRRTSVGPAVVVALRANGGAARLLRLPHDVPGLPAARAPGRRPRRHGGVRAGRRRRRRRQRHRHDDRGQAAHPRARAASIVVVLDHR